jgi:hypothetical protein
MPQLPVWTPILEIAEEWRTLFILPLVLCMFFAACPANANDYFVDPNGNDTAGDGSIGNPWQTIPKAVTAASAGDTIYVRGGTHVYTTPITISKNGTSSSKFYLFAYPGEHPVLDFSSMSESSSNRGIKLNASYWHIKGLDIYKAGDNGMIIENNGASYNRIELCIFRENRDTGLQLANGAHDNEIINCDSYYNCDSDMGDADGFAPKLTVGTGNYFYGCRAWNNSDDSWDGYLNAPTDNVTTTLENCWAIKAGYLKNGSTGSGNGNGFKMGSSTNHHNFILKNCLAIQNWKKGFDQNHNKGSMHLYNCTAFQNGGNNFSISEAVDSGYTAIIANGLNYSGSNSIGAFVTQITNSWSGGFTVTSGDFASIDPSAAYGPRKADGSLPDIAFMRLAGTSDLIDGGTDVGLPYHYDAPDLGAFEYIDGDCQPDGKVDLADLKCLADNWLDDNCGTCGGADFYDDNTVNFLDFAIMAENWMQ